MKAKYDTIGINYNTTRKADPFLTERLLHHLRPKTSGHYLDIGCGTGNYTTELSKRSLSFIGIDPSGEMLERAKEKGEDVIWKIGTADNTGLETASITGIVATLTIHHWLNLKTAFKELQRILEPAGKIVIFTSTPEQMRGYWLNEYFPNMLKASISQMPTLENVETAMAEAGLSIGHTEKYFVLPGLEDLFLYCGKHNPALYFKKEVRNGISSFSALSNIKEVDRGLQKLQQDITSGRIREVMESYSNNSGDYMFITAQKEWVKES